MPRACAIAITCLLVCTCAAQAPSRAPREQLRTGLPLSYYHSLAREVDRAVALTDQQADALSLLADQHQRDNIALRRTYRELRKALADLRAADTQVDEQRRQELNDRVEALRQELKRHSAESDPYTTFFDDIQSIMTDDQRPKLAALQTRLLEDKLLGSRVRKLLDDLPQTLALNAQQQEVLKSLRDQMRATLKTPRFSAADPADIEHEMLSAEDRGEFDTSDAMRAAAANACQNPQQALENLFGGLEPALSPDQQRKLIEFRKGTLEPMHARQVEVRTLLRTARRLELTTEQTDRLREIETAQSRKARAISNDAAALESLSKETEASIKKVLTEQQRAAFDRMLAHARR